MARWDASRWLGFAWGQELVAAVAVGLVGSLGIGLEMKQSVGRFGRSRCLYSPALTVSLVVLALAVDVAIPTLAILVVALLAVLLVVTLLLTAVVALLVLRHTVASATVGLTRLEGGSSG